MNKCRSTTSALVSFFLIQTLLPCAVVASEISVKSQSQKTQVDNDLITNTYQSNELARQRDSSSLMDDLTFEESCFINGVEDYYETTTSSTTCLLGSYNANFMEIPFEKDPLEREFQKILQGREELNNFVDCGGLSDQEEFAQMDQSLESSKVTAGLAVRNCSVLEPLYFELRPEFQERGICLRFLDLQGAD